MSKTWQAPPPPKVVYQQPDAVRDFDINADMAASASGLYSFETNLIAMAQGARDAAAYEMSNILSEVLTDSQDNYVPIDTGALRETGDFDRGEPEGSPSRSDLASPKLITRAVWYAGGINISSATVGRSTGKGEVHAGHRLGSRMRRNVRTYGPEHLGFHLQSPHFEEWANRRPETYAVDQHENLSYKHGLNWSGTGPGQAKYLERPFNAKVPEILPRLQGAVSSAWTGNPGSFSGD